MSKRKRGRPEGFKLSETSKRAISEAKRGQHHTQETRDKISKSLKLYFRRKNPLSKEILNRYNDLEGLCVNDWMDSVKHELDDAEEILTDRSIRNKGKIECAYGTNIEYFSHGMDPELLLLFKEHCLLNDVDPEDIAEEVF